MKIHEMVPELVVTFMDDAQRVYRWTGSEHIYIAHIWGRKEWSTKHLDGVILTTVNAT